MAGALAKEYPKTNEGRGVTLEPFADAVIGADLRQTSMLFLGVVAFVLLICCANVANLLLARATVRSRELAIRSALGADRPRLIRQLLTESVVLSIVGGALGLVLGAAILQVAPSVIPEGLLPPAVNLTFDLRLVAFCAGAALFVGLLFGLAPAWQATALQSAQALAANSRGSVGGNGRLRNMLVAGEVATAVLLLVGAGLLLRTLMAVQNVDRGYRAESVLTMLVDPLGSEYPTDEKLLQFYDSVEQEVRALPNVRSVAFASTLPMGTSYAGTFFVSIVGDPPSPDGKQPSADYQVVTPAYFDAVDLSVVTGRAFDERDSSQGRAGLHRQRGLRARAPAGAVADRHARVVARQTWSRRRSKREIVGVARQVKGRPDETDAFEQVYIPMAQDPLGDMFLMVRPATGSASVLAPSVRAAIARVDKQQLVSVRNVMTLEDVAWEATGRHRFRAVLVTAFAGLALVLAMVGLFGILAYSVQRRIRDLGVRRALGATTGDVGTLGARRRGAGTRDRPRRGRGAIDRARPRAGKHAVRRAAAGSADVRAGDRGARADRAGGGGGASVESNARGSGRGFKGRVTQPTYSSSSSTFEPQKDEPAAATSRDISGEVPPFRRSANGNRDFQRPQTDSMCLLQTISSRQVSCSFTALRNGQSAAMRWPCTDSSTG